MIHFIRKLISAWSASGGAGGVITWTGTPAPVFLQGQTTPYSLGSFLSGGYNAGTDTITCLQTLPSWLRLSGASLIPDGTQVNGNNSSGYVFRAMRNSGTPADSAQVSISVVLPVSGTPSWRAGLPLNTWIDIPNSAERTTTGGGISPSYLTLLNVDPSNVPQVGNNWLFTFIPNKYGIYPNLTGGGYPYTYRSWVSSHESYGGITIDHGNNGARLPSIISYTGDVDWPDNTVYRFNLMLDSPTWTIAVLGASFLEIKNNWPVGDTVYNAGTYPHDDHEDTSYYDGSPRACHLNRSAQFDCVANRALLLTRNQWWNADLGASLKSYYADLTSIDGTGYPRWSGTRNYTHAHDVGDVPGQVGVPQYGQILVSHPATGDVYVAAVYSINKLASGSNSWTTLWQDSGVVSAGYPINDSIMCVNHTNSLLFGVTTYAGPAVVFGGSPGRKYWTLTLSGTFTLMTLVAGSEAFNLETDLSATFGTHTASLVWVPDFNAYIFKCNNADEKFYVLSVSGTTVTVSSMAQTNTYGFANLSIGGGPLNNIHYIDALKGLVFRIGDRTPIRFFPTGVL
jgi:hypothetical protein